MGYDLSNLGYVEEIRKGYISLEEASEAIINNRGLSFIDNGKCSKLLGQSKDNSALIKVVSNIGVSSKKQRESELKKIEKLVSLPYSPDMIFDHTGRGVLSERNLDENLYAHIAKEYKESVVVATAPIMMAYRENKGIYINELLEIIEHMASNGVRFMLFHPTTTPEIWSIAQKNRIKPSTSWTGTLLHKDIEINKRTTNIIEENFDEILKILKQHL